MELVPLKVEIGLKSDGSHDFPNFNEINPNLRDGLDWSIYIDQFGGWHYDQISGHVDDDPLDGSPRGTWIGMLLVPDAFAQAAVTQFPTKCSIITEAKAQGFYEQRGHVRDPEIREDTDVLQAIKAKRDLAIPEDQADLDALNPDHPALGRRRNKRKTWAGFKTAEGVTIKP